MLQTKDFDGGLSVKDSGMLLDTKAISDEGVFEGYCSVFGVVDSYSEVVKPGAFAKSLAKRKAKGIKLLWQHDSKQPIGVWEDLAEDAKGLWGRGRLLIDVSPKAKEAHGLLKAGALDGLSIGYKEIDVKPDSDRPGIVNLWELDLRENSVVTFQANERSRVETVKSIMAGGTLPTVREFEEHLRDVGFSRSQAAAIASKAAPHLRGEPGGQADEAVEFLRALRA